MPAVSRRNQKAVKKTVRRKSKRNFRKKNTKRNIRKTFKKNRKGLRGGLGGLMGLFSSDEEYYNALKPYMVESEVKNKFPMMNRTLFPSFVLDDYRYQFHPRHRYFVWANKYNAAILKARKENLKPLQIEEAENKDKEAVKAAKKIIEEREQTQREKEHNNEMKSASEEIERKQQKYAKYLNENPDKSPEDFLLKNIEDYYYSQTYGGLNVFQIDDTKEEVEHLNSELYYYKMFIQEKYGGQFNVEKFNEVKKYIIDKLPNYTIDESYQIIKNTSPLVQAEPLAAEPLAAAEPVTTTKGGKKKHYKK